MTADVEWNCRGNPPVNVLEKPAQCGADYALQFAFGRQLHLPVPEPLAGVVKETVCSVRLKRCFPAQPMLEFLFVLSRRKAPVGMLPDQE
jgi:hypothetical protein